MSHAHRRSGHRRGPKVMTIGRRLLPLTAANAEALRAAAGGTCPTTVKGSKGGSCQRMCEELVQSGLLDGTRDGFGVTAPFFITPKGQEALAQWLAWRARRTG
jgi:hypothetical protein